MYRGNDEPIEKGQQFALNKLMCIWCKERECRLWVLAQLLERDQLTSTNDLTLGDWRTIRDFAYPDWRDNDWTPGGEFGSHVQSLVERYNEEVLGQLRLF